MSFHKVRERLKKNIEKMMADSDHLFTVNADGEELYDKYLSSFDPEYNPMFRERTEHDCSECRLFIKRLGGLVAIKDNKVQSIWDFEPDDKAYDKVVKNLSEHVKSHAVNSVFLSEAKRVGVMENFEMMEDGSVNKWEHFYADLDAKFVENKNRIPTKLNDLNTKATTFKRALDEISIDAVMTVIELSESNTLYKGQEYLSNLKSFLEHKLSYDKLTDKTEKTLYAFKHGVALRESIAKIRNTAIGTLLVDISDGKDLENAVKAYETITAPTNYKRSKPIFTQKMLDDAKKTVDELGYTSAFARRFARTSDISIRDVLFANRDAVPFMKKDNDIFGELSKQAVTTAKNMKFDKVEEVSVDNFLENILPKATELSLYLESNLAPNFVSLTTSEDETAKPLFKWGNSVSHVYNGNVTDSMKELVAKHGGNVTGDLRFSIMWNEDGKDDCDLDAHCKIITDRGFSTEIYYRDKYDYKTKGQLDVDIITPGADVAVENITFPNKNLLPDGIYKMFVNQFSGSARNGFRAEIEFNGNIYKFDYNHPIRTRDNIAVADIIVKNGEMTIKPLLDSDTKAVEIWNLTTNNFVPVTMALFSPNHWENNKVKTGHKHLLFMLKDCINPENPSGIFNEYLVDDLYAHRRVMEALTSKIRVPDDDNQLSGIGFALDKRNHVVLKVKGQVERVIKVMF